MNERPLYSFPISVDRKEPIRDGSGSSVYSYVRRSGDKSLLGSKSNISLLVLIVGSGEMSFVFLGV